MKPCIQNVFYVVICVLLVLVLVACGSNAVASSGTVVPPSATHFVASFNGRVAFLEWKDTGKGQLAGFYMETDTSGQKQQVVVTGRKHGAATSFSAAHFALNGIPGIQVMQTHLFNGDGAVQSVTWYAASQHDYQLLALAFPVYSRIDKDKNTVDALLRSPVSDSDPTYFQAKITEARNYLTKEQASLDVINATTQAKVCPLIQTFQTMYPASQHALQLPFALPQDTSPQNVIDRGSLSRAMDKLQQDWQQGKSFVLPRLTAFHPGWLSNPEETLASAEMALGQLQTAVLSTADWLQEFKMQQQAIQNQIRQMAIKCM